MKRKGIICLLGLFFILISVAQQGGIIKSIQFKGNKRTKEAYLKRFLTLKEGLKYDSILHQSDIQQLKNLQLFYELNPIINDSLGGIHLVYELKEVIIQLPTSIL